jgi:hypothetical protein
MRNTGLTLPQYHLMLSKKGNAFDDERHIQPLTTVTGDVKLHADN